ncbi:nuclease domain-containing protein [Paraburkholderia sp. C35]|uniref:nuclease domain-containing protein n=1 Tax=Paraburkholderia sp. C35 TaxID=2126993 RepID=UPI000D68858F|nr:nuclease domain-containing protein [Paraburkholderia sp. C35]
MSRITESARGEACTLNFPLVCNWDWETTVWAHSNWHDGGKAKGKKLARVDHLGCYACYACHKVLDGQDRLPAHLSRDFVMTRFATAMAACEVMLRRKGLWPSDEFLAAKPVTAHKPIQKKVTPLAARVSTKKVTPHEERSREPVGAGRGFPKVRNAVFNNAIVAAKPSKEKPTTQSANRWPKGRKLVSASKLQSRPFGSR